MIHSATASTHSAGSGWPSGVLVVAAVLASGLLIAGPALRRHYPVVWWVCIGFPAACIRVVRTWRPLMAGCGLAISRRAALTVVSGLVGNGRRRLNRAYRDGGWCVRRRRLPAPRTHAARSGAGGLRQGGSGDGA